MMPPRRWPAGDNADPAMRGRVQEVENRMIDAARTISAAAAEKLRQYHGSATPHLGLSASIQSQAYRQGYSFSALAAADQLPVWDAVWWAARHHETRLQALFFTARLRKTEDLIGAWPTVSRWIGAVDSWDMSDELSALYTRILEVLPDEVYPVFCAWNRSANAWERRQSIVGLLYYGGLRRRLPSIDRILPLVEMLIEDEDRFVQKGIGWTLREALRPTPQRPSTSSGAKRRACHLLPSQKRARNCRPNSATC
jgi:3-methyladenine DNA glycosylase AlkD